MVVSGVMIQSQFEVVSHLTFMKEGDGYANSSRVVCSSVYTIDRVYDVCWCRW